MNKRTIIIIIANTHCSCVIVQNRDACCVTEMSEEVSLLQILLHCVTLSLVSLCSNVLHLKSSHWDILEFAFVEIYAVHSENNAACDQCPDEFYSWFCRLTQQCYGQLDAVNK